MNVRRIDSAQGLALPAPAHRMVSTSERTATMGRLRPAGLPSSNCRPVVSPAVPSGRPGPLDIEAMRAEREGTVWPIVECCSEPALQAFHDGSIEPSRTTRRSSGSDANVERAQPDPHCGFTARGFRASAATALATLTFDWWVHVPDAASVAIAAGSALGFLGVLGPDGGGSPT